MWAAGAVLSGLVALEVAAVLLVLVVPVVVPHEPQLPAPGPLVLLRLLQLPPDPLLNLLSLPLPQEAVESEVRLRLLGRPSF